MYPVPQVSQERGGVRARQVGRKPVHPRDPDRDKLGPARAAQADGEAGGQHARKWGTVPTVVACQLVSSQLVYSQLVYSQIVYSQIVKSHIFVYSYKLIYANFFNFELLFLALALAKVLVLESIALDTSPGGSGGLAPWSGLIEHNSR